MKKLILIAFLVIMMLSLKEWLTCHNFRDENFFSFYNLKLTLEDAIHNDVNLPITIIRFYHNKLTAFISDSLSKYLLFWDIKFLTHLLSPVGSFGLILGFWHLRKFRGSETIVFINLLIILLLPLMEIFLKPTIIFPLKIIVFAFPFQTFAYFGLSRSLSKQKDKKVYLLLTLLIWVSIFWILVLKSETRNFCS